MPFYVYECEDGHEVEVMQGIKEEPLTECTENTNLDRMLSDSHVPCGKPCKRVIQRCFFKIEGGGVYNPGFQ